MGVLIDGAGASLNTIAGNYIGTDAPGSLDLGNGFDGVNIRGAEQHCRRFESSAAGQRHRREQRLRRGDRGHDRDRQPRARQLDWPRASNGGSAARATVSTASTSTRPAISSAAPTASGGQLDRRQRPRRRHGVLRHRQPHSRQRAVRQRGPGDRPRHGERHAERSPATATPAPTSPELPGILTPAAGGVEGTLNSRPNATYRIEYFASQSCDPSGNGEGQVPARRADRHDRRQREMLIPPSRAAVALCVTATATEHRHQRHLGVLGVRPADRGVPRLDQRHRRQLGGSDQVERRHRAAAGRDRVHCSDEFRFHGFCSDRRRRARSAYQHGTHRHVRRRISVATVASCSAGSI